MEVYSSLLRPNGFKVPKFLIRFISFCFLSVVLLQYNKPQTLTSSIEWLFKLKCLVTSDFATLLFLISDRCSLNLSPNLRPVSPT